MKTARGVAEIRLTVEKLLKGHNSGKNQSSMISIKFDHLQVKVTITRKLHQNPLKREMRRQDCVYGRAADGQSDEPITIVPFD